MMKVNWPDGKRIAIMLDFDIDAELMWMLRNDENDKHPANISRGHYSVRQGVPRILKLLENEGIKATFFTPAWVAERNPDLIRAIHEQGHEIGYHGWMHEAKETYAEEKALMEKVDAIYEDLIGVKPVGHRAPEGDIYDYSLGLWAERGYIYSSNWRSSDGPFIHQINGKPIPLVELPKDSVFDDTAYDMYTESVPTRASLRAGREMCQVWKDEFDALAAEGRMINFVMHPQFMGRPGNVRPFRELIHYMRDNGAWFATNEQVARYVLRQAGMME